VGIGGLYRLIRVSGSISSSLDFGFLKRRNIMYGEKGKEILKRETLLSIVDLPDIDIDLDDYIIVKDGIETIDYDRLMGDL